MSVLHILQLVGSVHSEFHTDLSRLYAHQCDEAFRENPRYPFHHAYVTPDRQWRFPASLTREDIAAAPPLSLAEAIAEIQRRPIDLALPQMFCVPGMTAYRALLDVMQLPYIGNRFETMALAADKAKTKAVLAEAGVRVPHGERLRQGDRPTLKPPAIVKPIHSDNSLGVALVKDAREYEDALTTAFQFADEVLVEQYVPLGREVRCGAIVRDGELVGLPMEEYGVSEDGSPIRAYADKLHKGDDGELHFAAKGNGKSWIVDPSDPDTARVQAAVKRAHVALGCRHYSLFDVRIDPNGQPWLLEAGLYCSFSPYSVIPAMAKVAGISLEELLETAIAQLDLS